jgi:anti-sigma-K factor RskA
MRRRRREAHTLSGAYAMDALSQQDRARFERHLTTCEECAREVAGLREAAARLAAAAAASPPPDLRDRVLAAAAVTRQQPPAAAGDRHLAGRRRRFRPAVAAGAVAAAAALAATVVFGVANGSMRQQLDQARSSSQQVAAVLTARDATMMTGTVAGGGTATVVMSHARDALVFTAADLHPLPASRGYELWLIGPSGDRPVAMLPPASHGMTGPVVAWGLRQGDRLGLTAEPAGGAGRPSTPMMLDIPL